MKRMTKYTEKHRIAFEEDLRIGSNEITHLVAQNIILQTFFEAQKRVGEARCECGNICVNDTLIMFSIFKTIESWSPRKVVEDSGSLTMDDEFLNTVHLCHAAMYCRECDGLCDIYSSLDYEDQMEILIGQLEAVGIKMSMPCRPKCVENKNRLVTAFLLNDCIEGEEEYYLATDEGYGSDDEKEPDEVDDTGWKKAFGKFYEK
ncbi:hypothetical protein [Methanosarcina sp.]|uniref:hypothetical protein n=1 Tax=Methanosarcina sp. TaxID=2213 RepID=UPI003BB78975